MELQGERQEEKETMSFSDKLRIEKIIVREPENVEEWLKRFIDIIMKEKNTDKRELHKIVPKKKSNVCDNR